MNDNSYYPDPMYLNYLSFLKDEFKPTAKNVSYEKSGYDFEKYEIKPNISQIETKVNGIEKTKKGMPNIFEPISDTLEFGASAYNTLSNTSNSKKESNAQTLDLTVKGAKMGSSIGSIIPGVGTLIGGAVGAVGGLTTGLIDAKKDKIERQKKYDNERKSKLDKELSYYNELYNK